MFAVFLTVFVVTVLANWYIIIFGKKDLEQLKSKLSVRKYLNELEESLDSQFGHNATTIIKLSIIGLSIVIIIFNALAFLSCIVAFVVGTIAAKKSYQVGSVSNILNKIGTYINRLR